MKILLIGEYSRLHNSLQEGLQMLGNDIKILGFNDGFKNFDIDYKINKKWDSGFLKKIKVAVYRISGFDISSFCTYLQFKKIYKQLDNYDVIQLINENSFFCTYYYEQKILNLLFQKTSKTFLLSCGDDFLNVKYNFENPHKKSVIQPYLEGKIQKKDFLNTLKFQKNEFRKLHNFIYENIDGVIASDLDYHYPLVGNAKYSGLVANPINISNLKFEQLQSIEKIVIFLGINKESYYKKGLDYFEKALEIVKNKYQEKIEVIITENLPYKTYIKSYKKAHIVLDQIYALDQGYNALEAMAKGKVVFTGADKKFSQYYNISEIVAINALPNVNYLVDQLSLLIEDPAAILKISKNARQFIEKEHDYIEIAKKYNSIWLTN